MSRALAAALSLAVALGSAPARAQQCDVFTDVASADSFCPAVQWLKNRSITSGCTQTAYCPNSDVTRAKMALFMNRLGVALTPLHFGATASFSAPAALAPNQFVPLCITTALPAANFPRLARARGYLTVPAGGSTLLQMFLVHDPAPPGPWSNSNTVSLSVPNPAGQHNLAWASNVIPIPAGTSMRFAIGLANPATSSGTLTPGAGGCVLDESVVNDNPSTPPLDAD